MAYPQKVFQIDPKRYCILCGTVFKQETNTNWTLILRQEQVKLQKFQKGQYKAKDLLGKENYLSLHVMERNTRKNNSSCCPSQMLLSNFKLKKKTGVL